MATRPRYSRHRTLGMLHTTAEVERAIRRGDQLCPPLMSGEVDILRASGIPLPVLLRAVKTDSLSDLEEGRA